MNLNNQSSVFVIGLALFAMFFGSGNLIYPLYIGTVAEGSWISAAGGFLLTAVLLPFLGVTAMVVFKGNYDDFFQILGKRGGFLLTALLLTVWIPLGSGPRCMALSHASLASYMGDSAPSFFIFSLIYSALVFVVISRKLGVLDILGKVITPLLIGCLAVIIFNGMFDNPVPTPSVYTSQELLKIGLVEGYNTMDLIASFFFSASVIHLLSQSGATMKSAVTTVIKASVVGISLLGAVYVGMISLAANHAGTLVGVPKEQFLAQLAQSLMGVQWSFLAIAAIILACFSTSIALVLAYTDFIHEEVLQAKQHPVISMVITLAITFVMSFFGLEGIAFVTGPVLQICYPVLIVLILANLVRLAIQRRLLMVSH